MWDHNRSSWIPIDSVEWKFKDLIPKPIYDNIELVRGTEVKADQKIKVLEEGKMVDIIVVREVYEKDYLRNPDGSEYHVYFENGQFLLKDRLPPHKILGPLNLIYSQIGWRIVGNAFEGVLDAEYGLDKS